MSMNGPPKVESKEDKRPSRYRTIERDVLSEKEDITYDADRKVLTVVTRFERSVSCNGAYHRQFYEDISYDKDDIIVYAKEVRREGLGPCDGKHS